MTSCRISLLVCFVVLDHVMHVQCTARTAEVSTTRQQYEDLWKECTTLRNELISNKVCVCVFVYVCACVCMCVCMCVYMCVHACMHVYMFIHTYMYNVQGEVHKATEQLVSLQNQKLQLERKLKEV